MGLHQTNKIMHNKRKYNFTDLEIILSNYSPDERLIYKIIALWREDCREVEERDEQNIYQITYKWTKGI